MMRFKYIHCSNCSHADEQPCRWNGAEHNPAWAYHEEGEDFEFTNDLLETLETLFGRSPATTRQDMDSGEVRERNVRVSGTDISYADLSYIPRPRSRASGSAGGTGTYSISTADGLALTSYPSFATIDPSVFDNTVTRSSLTTRAAFWERADRQ